MISQAGQWTQTPSTTPLQPIKWNAHFLITFNFWWSAGLVNGIKPHLPALFSQKKWNATFWITFNFWWSAGLVNGLEPHPPLVSSQKNEMLIFWLCSLQMIGRAGQWTWTPSTTLLQPKKWNPHFCITFNFWCWLDWSMDSNPIHHHSPANKMKCFFLDYVHYWWSARLVNGLKPHLPPLSAKKIKCSYFDYVQLLMTGRAGQWTWKKMKCLFLDYVRFWWSAWLIDELKPHLPPLSYQRMKCSIFDYIQLLMTSRAGKWTWAPSTMPLQPKTWNAHFWILFNFWWSARLVNGLEPHLPPLSSQKSEMLISVLQSTSDFGQTGQWTRTPSTTRLQPIKWNAWFWIMLNFWWLAGLVEGLEPHQPPLSSLKHEMLVFVLHSTSDVGQAAQWTQTPSATLSSQKNEILIFGLCSTSDDQLGWSMDLNPICHPSPAKKVKWSFLDYIQLLMIGQAGWWTQTPSTTTLQSKNEILIFGLRWTSDDWPGWSMDSNPICHPSFAKKMKCSFLDYVQLPIIGLAGRWTQTPSASPLQLIKWNAHFWNTFNFWWSAWLVNGLKPHPPPLSSQ